MCQAFTNSGLREKYGNSDVKSIYFAIIDSTSTAVYYKTTNGLVPPDEVGDDDAESDALIRWKKPSKSRKNKS